MEEVRRLREGKGWNQTELAYHAGLAPSVISQIENGKRSPSARTLEKLAGALDVSVGELFPGKAQAPLPFEELEEPQWRSDVMEGWTRFMNRWAKTWGQAHDEESGELVRGAFADQDDPLEKARHRCWMALEDHVMVLERFEKALSQHYFLHRAGDLPAMGRSQMEEIEGAVRALGEVNEKWQATTRAVLEAAPEEVDPRILERLQEQAEGSRRKVALLLEERRSA